MEKYHPVDTKCPKCAAYGKLLKLKHHALPSSEYHMGCDPAVEAEHIAVKCRRCKYRWAVLPRDIAGHGLKEAVDAFLGSLPADDTAT